VGLPWTFHKLGWAKPTLAHAYNRHWKYVNQFAGERIFKIGEHFAKLQAKWLIVSYTPLALDVCPQRCKTRQISKITCV